MGRFHGELSVSTGSRRYDKTKGVTRPSASTLGRRVGQKKKPIPKVKRQYTDSQVAKFLSSGSIRLVSDVGNEWLYIRDATGMWNERHVLRNGASDFCAIYSGRYVAAKIQESQSCEAVK